MVTDYYDLKRCYSRSEIHAIHFTLKLNGNDNYCRHLETVL